MITISKYTKKKPTEGVVINQAVINNIDQMVTETAQYAAQKTAEATIDTITMTATVDADGNLIMESATAITPEVAEPAN